MQLEGLKPLSKGGEWIGGRWGSEETVPDDHELRVAPDTVCKTHGNNAAVLVQCRSRGRYHR